MLTYLNKIIGITKAAFPVVGMNMVKLTTELTEENQNLCNDLDRMIASPGFHYEVGNLFDNIHSI